MLLYDENMDNKMLQKKRIMQYFIDSAEYIIDKEGIDNITIRKVASLAGYNSATLYNYFENLDHLIFVVGLNHLENYHNALPNYIKDCENSLEFYMEVCRYCFLSRKIKKKKKKFCTRILRPVSGKGYVSIF